MNFKWARYNRPNYSDDSDTGNGIGFKDLLISDVHQETLHLQNAPISESEDMSPLTAYTVEEEHHDPLVIAIIPIPVVPDDAVEVKLL